MAAPAAYAVDSSQTITQGFRATDSNIVAGALVSTTQTDPQTVELATTRSLARLVGVVDGSPFVSISGSAGSEIQVVSNGAANALVSDINGPVKTGDEITASPIAGVGMRATTDSQVVGSAQSDLSTAHSRTQTIKDSSGNPHSVRIGYVSLRIGLAYYRAPGSNFLPPIVQQAAASIAGRPVSFIRILICSLLLLIGFVTIVIILYTATRSAMVSMGRNPLARRGIMRGLYQVIAVAIIIALATMLAGYLVLSA